MKMENNIEDKVVSWLIIQKLKGFEFFNFLDCSKDIGLDYNNKYHIKKIDNGIEKFNKINQFVVNFFEENN